MDYLSGTFGLFVFAASALTMVWMVYSKYCDWQNHRKSAERNLKFVNVENFFVEAFKGDFPGKRKDMIVKKEGKAFCFSMFFKFCVLLADPELVGLVLSSQFTNFTNRREFKIYDPVFKSALTVLMDDQWKRVRSIISPTFSMGSLRRMKPRIDVTLETLLENIENASSSKNGIVNFKPLFSLFTLDTIIQVAFGVSTKVDETNQVVVMAKRLFQQELSFKSIPLYAFVFMFPRLSHALNIRVNGNVSDFFMKFSMEIIKQKREEFRKNKENKLKADNFIELLLEAERENEKQSNETDKNNKQTAKFVSNEEIIANSVVFFLAGYETVSTSVSIATFLIATHPKVQEKLVQEIHLQLEKLKKESENSVIDPIKLVTLESLTRFEYLNAVVSETLRLYTPTPFIERTASKDVKLETSDGKVKINIKKEDIVHMPVYSLHYDPLSFENPDSFNPDRFMGNPKYHKYSFIPFGAGPRSCIARTLALFELKLALLHIFNSFKVSPCSETKIPMEFFNQGTFIVPKDCILKVEKR